MPNDKPLRLVKDEPAKSEPLSRFGQPGPETDMFLPDVAREVMASVLETAQSEQGTTVEATETTARILLLAAADLWWGDIEVAGRGMLLSTLLLAALDEIREQLIAPPGAVTEQEIRERLTHVARAGLRGEQRPPADALTVPRGTAHLARAMLAALNSAARSADDGGAPPPIAA